MLVMKGIKKIYQVGDEEVRALDGVDLTVQDHEFVAIIGASGSGKSTLMNIIGCLDSADEGTYMIDGQDVSDLSEHDQAILRNRKIGFIFQQFNLLPKLSAFENVELPLIYQGVPAAERKERSRQALIRVGLEKRMNHKPNQMSGGQQQRVAVARALVTNPSLILADEPTGNLDSHSTRDIMQLLVELNKAGNTLILITHDDEIAAAAPRRVRLMDGRIISDSAAPDAAGANGVAAGETAAVNRMVPGAADMNGPAAGQTAAVNHGAPDAAGVAGVAAGQTAAVNRMAPDPADMNGPAAGQTAAVNHGAPDAAGANGAGAVADTQGGAT